ncbi:MAG: hypothetical protein KZQ97_04375 [Candidatus Thiodiazotropha sp. (ex Dulcina madagascariensis)]|nr:hypothetical protein [Candidatus Thiodiazotropha sp. (ex Dulcina madagascariensis)]
MDIGKIQIGIDIATAVSVVTAAIAFIYSNIRENRRNREIELNEQKKLRNLRVSEYKIEKITEIINYLNDKIYQLAKLNNEIDSRLRLKMDSNKIKINTSEKKEISYLLRNDELHFNKIPEKYRISELLHQIILIHQNIKNYLSYNPYVELIGIANSTGTINELLAINTDFYIRVKDIENNPRDFGYFLKQEIDSGFMPIGKIRKTVEDENKNKNQLPKNYQQLICKACLDDFDLLKEEKKIYIYLKFLKQKLEKLHSLRDNWLNILEYIEESIRSLSSYSFSLVHDYEEVE